MPDSWECHDDDNDGDNDDDDDVAHSDKADDKVSVKYLLVLGLLVCLNSKPRVFEHLRYTWYLNSLFMTLTFDL